MARCERCIHERACESWIRHGKILYDDFDYSVEDCPFHSNRDCGHYIKLEDLQKFPIRKDHYDKEHGDEHFIYGVETVFEYAEYLPTYDVVPKSEVQWIFDELYKSVASKLPMQIRLIFKDERNFEYGFRDGKYDALIEVLVLIANLKKKYTEEKI